MEKEQQLNTELGLDEQELGTSEEPDIPSGLDFPLPKHSEPIPSQEILSLKMPDGLEIQTGSQILTPQGLAPILLQIYDHITNKPQPTKRAVGIG